MTEMAPLEAAKWLAVSGGLAILWSTMLGFVMLIPQQGRKADGAPTTINWRQIGAAHLDWIMLGLMSMAAALLLTLFGHAVPSLLVAIFIFGAWINPTAYVFRAFGINAFRFSGSGVQKGASLLSGVSSLAILISWLWIFAIVLLA
jgi:hypothetical protein